MSDTKNYVVEEFYRQFNMDRTKYQVEVEENQIIVRNGNRKQIYYYVVLENQMIRFFSLSRRNNKGFLCNIIPNGFQIKGKNVKSQTGKISQNRIYVNKQMAILGMVATTAILTFFPTTAKTMNNEYPKIEYQKDLEEHTDFTTPVSLESSVAEDSLEETKLEIQELPEETMEKTMEETVEETIPETTEEIKPVFYDVKCPADIQEFMYETCLEYGVPFQVGMTIGHIESRGNWNNSGKVSNTNDYGYMQINKVNMNELYEEFHEEGESKEDFLHAMQYNDKRNIKCSIYLLSKICDMYEPDDFENILGTYNGWKKWREKKISREYVALGEEYLNTIYVPLENDETRAFTRK